MSMKFGKVYYYYAGEFRTRSEAEKVAEKKKAEGYKARIIRYGRHPIRFRVYVKKK